MEAISLRVGSDYQPATLFLSQDLGYTPLMAQNTHWFKWSLMSHGSKGKLIRRYRKKDGKREWETLPKVRYAHLNSDEVEALLKRLNASLENDRKAAQERYRFDHAYINKTVLLAFEGYLETKANNKEYIRKLISTLNEYPFEFFIHKPGRSDPGQTFSKFLNS